MTTKQKSINLSNKEIALLQSYTKTSPLVLVRFKAQAVLLTDSNVSAPAIAQSFNRKPRTIQQWLKGWHDYGLSSIFSGHAANLNASRLTKEQLYEIQQVLQSPPSDFGLPKEFWDVPQLKTYISTNFDVIYESGDSYHFLLEFGNLSFKYADTFDRKRDEAFINERMLAKEIKPLFHNDDWEIFASYEVRIEQEAEIRRAWLQKGERTIVKVNRKKESQSYIGFLNQKTFDCELIEMPWQKSSEVIKAFEQFLAKHPDKHIAIIWDDAPFHRSKEIRAALRKGKTLERVHLIPMPPYAPDHNPIEHVWNTTKQHIANIQHETFEQTKSAFSEFIGNRKFRYAI